MKLGISYNLFDGEELLEASLKSVRKAAYHINVVYQTTSYYGSKTDSNLYALLKELKEKGLIDYFYEYKSDFKYADKHIYERKKRDIGLSIAKKHGCSHFLSMDVDEFYDSDELICAMQFIERKNIKCSAVSIKEYLKSPQYRFLNAYTYTPEKNYGYYVPFIMKINKFMPQKHDSKWFPCLTDPSRRLNNRKKFYLFSPQTVEMHHMSTVRKNLEKKYKNSNLNLGSCKERSLVEQTKNDVLDWSFEKYQLHDSNFSFFQGKIVEKVENRFEINID